jgi:hypothetical protein
MEISTHIIDLLCVQTIDNSICSKILMNVNIIIIIFGDFEIHNKAI